MIAGGPVAKSFMAQINFRLTEQLNQTALIAISFGNLNKVQFFSNREFGV